jgi:hypothetical protein
MEIIAIGYYFPKKFKKSVLSQTLGKKETSAYNVGVDTCCILKLTI